MKNIHTFALIWKKYVKKGVIWILIIIKMSCVIDLAEKALSTLLCVVSVTVSMPFSAEQIFDFVSGNHGIERAQTTHQFRRGLEFGRKKKKKKTNKHSHS